MSIEVQLDEFGEKVLRDSGVKDLQQFTQDLLLREVMRRWHILRSRPKDKLPSPVGRPPLSPEIKRVRELAETLSSVYLKLREFYGEEDFQRYFGAQYSALEAAIAASDLPTLVEMTEKQPWILSKT